MTLARQPGRLVLASVFMVAGALHFALTPVYLKLMPAYLPAPLLLVRVSGACEAAGGLGLLVPATRRFAAWGLVALLIAVFPANVTMITDPSRFPQVPHWAAWARLPLQLPLIWWAWRYTKSANRTE